MKLSVKGLATAFALLWGGCLLLVGILHLAMPAYGAAFLQGMSSVYPGFHGSSGIVDVLVGTMTATVDGAIGGALLAWLYNTVSRTAGA